MTTSRIPFAPIALQKTLKTKRLHAVRFTAFADAAGNDSWPHSDAWYIAVMAFARDSHRWKQYQHWHKAQPGGVHLSEKGMTRAQRNQIMERTFGPDKPWDMAFAFIVDTHAYRSRLRTEAPHDFSGSDHYPAWHVWVRLSGMVSAPILIMSDMGGISHIPIKRLVFNHPGAGRKGELAIRAGMDSVWGRLMPVRFDSGKNPGISIVDTIAWSLRRVLTHPHQDPMPGLEAAFHQRMIVQVLRDPQPQAEVESIPTLAALKKLTPSQRPGASGETSPVASDQG